MRLAHTTRRSRSFAFRTTVAGLALLHIAFLLGSCGGDSTNTTPLTSASVGWSDEDYQRHFEDCLDSRVPTANAAAAQFNERRCRCDTDLATEWFEDYEAYEYARDFDWLSSEWQNYMDRVPMCA
jgi:hypothetical protein